MSRIKFVSLILLIVVDVCSSIESNSNDKFPILWAKAPSSISDYPLIRTCSSPHLTSNETCRSIDPWIYLDRLGLYKILIDATSPLMPFCLTTNQSNILFGLPSQFSWQFQSNRLFSNGSQLLSSDSWWASANYYLSVIPFLAAVDVGIVQYQPFQIQHRQQFCSTIEQCFQQIPQAMNQWKSFFTNISQKNYCHTDHVDDRVIDQCYLRPMWEAHLASITHALKLIQSKIRLLPSINEQRFGLAWANLVDFIGRSRKNTNLFETNKYQEAFLPQRMLTDEDHPPYCPDLPVDVNKAVEILLFLHDDWYPELRRLWKPVTCNFEARQDAQHVLETIAVSTTTAAKYYDEALLKSLIYPCDQNMKFH